MSEKRQPRSLPAFPTSRVWVMILCAGFVVSWGGAAGLSQNRPAEPAAQDGFFPMSGGRPTAAEAARFLEHSTWGPTTELIQHVQTVGFRQFVDEQLDAPVSGYPDMPLYPGTAPDDCPSGSMCRTIQYTMYPLQLRFFSNALYAPDQLRQRVAFALHQIFVVSGTDVTLSSRMNPYLQILDRNAFRNYRQLLGEITLNPAMGVYLDMAGNTRTNPNENYAREVLQLFSVGLVRLNPDGSTQLDAQGQPIPTYDQQVVNAFARVFTGWRIPNLTTNAAIANYIDPMIVTAANHDVEAKTLLRGVTLPRARTAAQDLSDALDNIAQDPSVGPFISKQLIQHLVTSNPSPRYIQRVSRVFDDNGSGVRGDLREVVKAILLDPEALIEQPNNLASPGHLRHPALFITSFLRALNVKSRDLTTTSDGYINPQSITLGMDIYRPPSVFSYFSPFGGTPGSSLRGPEFGLFNTSTAILRANFVNTMVFSGINANTTTTPTGTGLDFSGLLPLAANPTELVQTLNNQMMYGKMSNEMKAAIVTAVSAVAATPAANTLLRVQTAVYLIATSAQYQVAR